MVQLKFYGEKMLATSKPDSYALQMKCDDQNEHINIRLEAKSTAKYMRMGKKMLRVRQEEIV